MIAQLASCRPDHLTPRGSHLTRYDVRGDTARSLLLTILQEFVLPEGRPVWTSSLLQVLYETGVGGSAARQAISRAAGVGWIVGERQGREVCWSIARAGRLLMEGETSWRECPNHDEWDKRWLIILIAIPQAQRNERKKLYGILLNAGFGNPKPGIWLTPHLDRTVVARSAVEGCTLSKSTLAFIGRSAAIGLSDSEIVQHGWNLDELAVDYEELMHRCAVDTRRNHEVKVSDYVRTVNMWKALSMRDPQLPKGILADWIGRRATECYREWYADVSPVIYARWRELVSEVDIHARIR